MDRDHWDAVRRIYEAGIATGHATLETEVPDWEARDEAHLADCRLVALEDGDVLGWAALSPPLPPQPRPGITAECADASDDPLPVLLVGHGR